MWRKISDEILTDIADAIRRKTGTSRKYTPVEMVDAIDSIQTGGAPSGEVYFQTEETNLLTEVEPVPDSYITSSGAEVAYKGWMSSGYIPLDNAHVYVITGATTFGTYCAIYDENKRYIANPKPNSTILVPSAEMKYFRYSASNGSYSGVSLNRMRVELR